jgi:hypothetical protein
MNGVDLGIWQSFPLDVDDFPGCSLLFTTCQGCDFCLLIGNPGSLLCCLLLPVEHPPDAGDAEVRRKVLTRLLPVLLAG